MSAFKVPQAAGGPPDQEGPNSFTPPSPLLGPFADGKSQDILGFSAYQTPKTRCGFRCNYGAFSDSLLCFAAAPLYGEGKRGFQRQRVATSLELVRSRKVELVGQDFRSASNWYVGVANLRFRILDPTCNQRFHQGFPDGVGKLGRPDDDAIQ